MKQKESRNLFLFGQITELLSLDIIEGLLKFDDKNHEPIILRINSGGGELPSAYGIIDTMRFIKSKVITYITGRAASAAALISISGNGRWASKNSVWCTHPSFYTIEDYSNVVEDRMVLKKIDDKHKLQILKKYTGLLKQDFEKIRIGELWLNAKDSITKGVVDKIV